MAKVIRQSHRGVQQIKARDLVPGDIVDVSGEPASIYLAFYAATNHRTLSNILCDVLRIIALYSVATSLGCFIVVIQLYWLQHHYTFIHSFTY